MEMNWSRPHPALKMRSGRILIITCTTAKMCRVWNVMESTRKANRFAPAATPSSTLIIKNRLEKRSGVPRRTSVASHLKGNFHSFFSALYVACRSLVGENFPHVSLVTNLLLLLIFYPTAPPWWRICQAVYSSSMTGSILTNRVVPSFFITDTTLYRDGGYCRNEKCYRKIEHAFIWKSVTWAFKNRSTNETGNDSKMILQPARFPLPSFGMEHTSWIKVIPEYT